MTSLIFWYNVILYLLLLLQVTFVYLRVPIAVREEIVEMKSNEASKKLYSCPECSCTYTRKNKLKRHLLDKHDTLMEDNFKNNCLFPGCEESFYTKLQLIEHTKKEHGIKYEEKHFDFNSIEDFLQWKEKEEVQNLVYFPKHQGDTKGNIFTHMYFYCQYDGHEKPHRRSDEPSRKTNRTFRRGQMKKGNFCPARITARIDKIKKSVKVHYISTHSHNIDLEGTKFHPIPPTIRNEVKAKLSLGVPVNDVFKDIRVNLGDRDTRDIEDDTITKVHLIAKSNIRDLKRQISYSRRLHPDDSISTHLLVNKLKQESYNPILVYKPQGENVLIGPKTYNDLDLMKDTFVIGIQTKQQRDMFVKGAKKILCIDGTHNTNQYAFPLVNILVPDEFGKGYPVAHLISNHADEMTLRPFLEEIKSRCPTDLKIQCVMTDDDNSGWNAITAVFGGSIQLLCKWHIIRAWKRKLPLAPEEIRKDLYNSLMILINEKDKKQFSEILNGFLINYSYSAPKFIAYFKEQYCQRVEKWAMCFRDFDHANTDTNMYAEAFHNRLKTFFMGRRPNKRIDDLIKLLLCVEEEDYWRNKRESIYYPSEKDLTLEGRHRRGMKISNHDIEDEADGKWKCKSQTTKDDAHTVICKILICEEPECVIM